MLHAPNRTTASGFTTTIMAAAAALLMPASGARADLEFGTPIEPWVLPPFVGPLPPPDTYEPPGGGVTVHPGAPHPDPGPGIPEGGGWAVHPGAGGGDGPADPPYLGILIPPDAGTEDTGTVPPFLGLAPYPGGDQRHDKPPMADGNFVTVHPGAGPGNDRGTPPPPPDGGYMIHPDAGKNTGPTCDPTQWHNGPAAPHSTGNPVDFAYGHKLVSEVDLHVELPGRDFTLSRSYTSRVNAGGPGLVGENWTLNVLDFMVIDSSEDDPVLTLSRPTKGSATFEYVTERDRWETAIPTTQYIVASEVQIDGKRYAVYSLVEPGRWQVDYYRQFDPHSGQEITPGYWIGLPAQMRDAYGNTRTFEYTTFDAGEPGPEDDVVRLTSLHLNGTPGADDAVAKLEFDWFILETDPEGAAGRVKSIEVVRPAGVGGGDVVTQRVEYTYFDNDGGFGAIGTNGDLLQVARYARVDHDWNSAPTGEEDRHITVEQYRYNYALSVKHLLLSVLNPEQIEYAAQQANRDAVTPQSVLAYANSLLALPIEGIAYNDGIQDVSLAELYAKRIGYDGTPQQRVKTQWLQTACGCGGSTHGLKLDYAYYPLGQNGASLKITENVLDEAGVWQPHRTRHFDLLEYTLPGTYDDVYFLQSMAVTEGEETQDSDYWVVRYDYDDAQGSETMVLEKVYAPSAIATYVPATEYEQAEVTFTPSGGLFHEYVYNDDLRLTAIYAHQTGVGLGEKRLEVTYGDDAVAGQRSYLPIRLDRYRVAGSTDPNDIETAEYSYGFHSSGQAATDISWIEVKIEGERDAQQSPPDRGENGPGGFYYSHEFFDTKGQNIWTRSATDSLTRRAFDSLTGVVVEEEYNADAAGLPVDRPSTGGKGITFAGRYADGGSLTTQWTVDRLGRQTSVTSADGVTTRFVREVRELPDASIGGRPGILYYAEVWLPHAFKEGGVDRFAGPASVNWRNAAGDVIASSTYRLAYNAASPYSDPAIFGTEYEFSLDAELSRSRGNHSVSGLVTSVDDWHSLDQHGENGGIYTTTYTYDSLGRMRDVTLPSGTTTRMEYDVHDRIVSVSVGVDSEPGQFTTLLDYYYDHEIVGGVPFSGVGNGRLTLLVEHADDDPANDRRTEYFHDWRDRLVAIRNAAAPHEVFVYDNLDRIAEQAVFSVDPTTLSDIDDADARQDRISYVAYDYSQRGALVRNRVPIDATVAVSEMSFLETNVWLDDAGRPIGRWNANGPGMKITYDGLGRPDTVYLTDRRDDAAPGEPLNFADVYNATSHTANVSGDVVIEQVTARYIAEQSYVGHTYNGDNAFAGLLDLVTTRVRTHDAGEDRTGDLSAFAGQNAALVISAFSGVYYDPAGRPIRGVEYGTNQAAFEYGGAAPAQDQTAPPGWSPMDEFLVVGTTYNERGLPDTITDPTGRVSKVIYDDLDRSIATIENYVDADLLPGDPWDAQDKIWKFINLDSAETDTDRVTSTVYLLTEQTVKHVAYAFDAQGLPTTQATEYIYRARDGAGVDDSRVNSNELLTTVIFPDTDADQSKHSISFAYNRLGEQIVSRDQNSTRHNYTYDLVGRLLRDRVTFAPGSPIDQTIDAVETVFDHFGRIKYVNSYSNYDSNPVVENSVKYAYTSLHQIETIWQKNDGLVAGDGAETAPFAAYTYDTRAVSSGNFSRLSSITYPDGSEVPYSYGTETPLSTDHIISRATTIGAGGDIEYDHIGLGMVALVDLAGPGVMLDRQVEHNGTRATGSYPAFDRFGRLTRHMWVDFDFEQHASYPTIDTVPNRPPVVEMAYLYDKASNRIAANDGRPGAMRTNRDFKYDYDGLHRLVESLRGVDTGGGGFDPVDFSDRFTPSQEYELDVLGNWLKVTTDVDGDGPDAVEDDVEDRAHNAANEMLDRDPDGAGGDDPLALTYDDAGNMRTQRVSPTTTVTFTHDAWNRLVKVEYSQALRAEYEYNGLGQRIIKRADTSTIPNGALNQQRAMYYSAAWQLIEERIDDDVQAADGDERNMQYVWGLRYIDDLVLRRENSNFTNDSPDITYEDVWYHLTDGNFSTVAIIDDAANLVERVSYDPYGQARHHYFGDVDGDGDQDSADLNAISTATAFGPVPIESANYNVDMDVDRNGVVNSTDWSLVNADRTHPALARGVLSKPGVDNQVGFSGYLYNAECETYTVRFRNYSVTLGRWLERDPLGYVDGSNLYEYVAGMPLGALDPLGLCASDDVSGGGGESAPPAKLTCVPRGHPVEQYYAKEFEGTDYRLLVNNGGWVEVPTLARILAGIPDWALDPHIWLQGGGMLPGVGVIFDAADAVLYAIEGDFASASISLAAAAPGAGQGVTVARWGKRAGTALAAAGVAAKVSRNADRAHTVYVVMKNGEVIYVGRTVQSLARRQAQHRLIPGRRQWVLREAYAGLTRAEARGIEHLLYLLHRPSVNILRPIWRLNPSRLPYIGEGARRMLQ